jgi:hypothetical protein
LTTEKYLNLFWIDVILKKTFTIQSIFDLRDKNEYKPFRQSSFKTKHFVLPKKNKFKHSNFLFYPFSEFVLSAYVILQWGDVCERENCKGGFSILYLLDWALDNVYKWAMNPNIWLSTELLKVECKKASKAFNYQNDFCHW